jgi:hypothetical protein
MNTSLTAHIVYVFLCLLNSIAGHYRTNPWLAVPDWRQCRNADAGLMWRTNGKNNDAGLTFSRYSGIPAFLFIDIGNNVKKSHHQVLTNWNNILLFTQCVCNDTFFMISCKVIILPWYIIMLSLKYPVSWKRRHDLKGYGDKLIK